MIRSRWVGCYQSITSTKTNKIHLWTYTHHPRSFFRIECSPIITAPIFILSLENETEQVTPISSIKIMHSWIFRLGIWHSYIASDVVHLCLSLFSFPEKDGIYNVNYSFRQSCFNIVMKVEAILENVISRPFSCEHFQ